MSRWSIDPPDDDRYDEKPPDVADEPRDGEAWAEVNTSPTFYQGIPAPVLRAQREYDDAQNRIMDHVDPPIDPAEHAAHAVIDALTDLEKEIATATTLERAHQLKAMLKRAYVQVNAVDLKASAKIDQIGWPPRPRRISIGARRASRSLNRR